MINKNNVTIADGKTTYILRVRLPNLPKDLQSLSLLVNDRLPYLPRLHPHLLAMNYISVSFYLLRWQATLLAFAAASWPLEPWHCQIPCAGRLLLHTI